MVGQPLDLLGHPVPGERLQGRDNAGMEQLPPLQQEAAVGDLMGEGMLEGVDTFGEQLRLIEKLGRLQVGQAPLEDRLGHVGNRVQQRQGHFGAQHDLATSPVECILVLARGETRAGSFACFVVPPRGMTALSQSCLFEGKSENRVSENQ